MSSSTRELLEEARTSEGMTLAELAREIPGRVSVQGDASVRVFGVQHDSRSVLPGDLFVVRKGEKHDGCAFIAQAIADGAVALSAAHDLDIGTPGVPVLRVPLVADGLAYAAAAVYGHPAFSLDIVGITGTNGKTTTTHLVRTAIDGALGHPRSRTGSSGELSPPPSTGIVGTIGHTYAGRTIAASHTTPEADELARVLAVMRKRGATHIAMEVSSIALVLRRVAAVRFRVAAFTNLTQDHLDFHGSMEAYAAAKLDLFTKMGPGLAVVNVDDAFGAKIAESAKCKVLRIRTKTNATDADVFPLRVEASAQGMLIVASVPGAPSGNVEIRTRLVGAHNVENLLVAMGVVSALELDVERAAAALASETGAPGRLERCDGPEDDIVVLVDYAHTPDALGRVLEAVRGVSGDHRVVCVFGCGGDRDASKRGPMGETVGALADVAIVTSDNPRTEDPAIIAQAVEQGVARTLARVSAQDIAGGARGYWVELDRRAAIDAAIAGARSGDVVLVAGKGHEDYQIVGTEKRAFDDRVEARRALRERRATRERNG
ncbi:MAG TPA: UDP-N-acetylmuramoyl-L-alanyl-D-glutamate--2,6-diaminopimelate ligase [Labilithrix sp.]|nr:UDP-N-acetylmuramoyl-L-alanyl-D-glutamate--2,6-diaminopimelate ligase [Labilithrix sp.]